MSAHRLYTPEVLAAAVSLSRYPLTDDLVLRGEARSKSCGSRIVLGLALDEVGQVTRVGMASHACAIGQACAAIFADGAPGRDAVKLRDARAAMVLWLRGEAAMPDWPGMALVAPAQAYPARHGAMLLAWQAACHALDAQAG